MQKEEAKRIFEAGFKAGMTDHYFEKIWQEHFSEWESENYKLFLPDSKRNLIELWESRKIEIEETGKCKNRGGEDFFSPKFTKTEMLQYCDKMIERVVSTE